MYLFSSMYCPVPSQSYGTANIWSVFGVRWQIFQWRPWAQKYQLRLFLCTFQTNKWGMTIYCSATYTTAVDFPVFCSQRKLYLGSHWRTTCWGTYTAARARCRTPFSWRALPVISLCLISKSSTPKSRSTPQNLFFRLVVRATYHPPCPLYGRRWPAVL